MTIANVAHLQPAWTFDTGASAIQVAPLVVNGIMYVTGGGSYLASPTGTKIVAFALAQASIRSGQSRGSPT